MNDNIKQIQGIKRPYEPNPTANVGYQPVAKKKKGSINSFFDYNK